MDLPVSRTDSEVLLSLLLPAPPDSAPSRTSAKLASLISMSMRAFQMQGTDLCFVLMNRHCSSFLYLQSALLLILHYSSFMCLLIGLVLIHIRCSCLFPS